MTVIRAERAVIQRVVRRKEASTVEPALRSETAALLSPPSAKSLVVDARSWRDWEQVASEWRDLVERCPSASFFVTPEWVATWLELFATSLDPRILLFRDSNALVVGACLVVERTERKGPFPIRRVYLNTAGEDHADSPWVEFNMLLCEAGRERAIAARLRRYLSESCAPWDEFCAPGIIEGPSLDALNAAFGELIVEDDCKPSRFVPLDEMRTGGKDYVDTLPSRERTRFRQNVRKYTEVGELSLVEPSNVEEALLFLNGLASLHQKTWTSRGFPGAFASKRFSEFHERLIRRCFPVGTAQLVQLRAGETVVGYHYNFVYRGRSYFYQCGYDYDLGEKTSPGATLHALAVRNGLQAGLREYDFMAGDVDYKKRLGSASRDMHWMCWRAPNVKMRAVAVARDAKRRLMSSPRFEHIRTRAKAFVSGLIPRRGDA